MKLRDLFGRKATEAPVEAPATKSVVVVRSFPSGPEHAFLTQITEQLASGPLNLPCFPDIVPRIRKALDDPNSTADDIVRIAGSEPRLAARLLQTANSAVFNRTGKSSPHLRAAVTRLGRDLVQSVVMVFAIQQMKAEPALRPVADPLNDLWEKSVAVASICQVLAQQLRVPVDRVFLLGLLHGIGHFYILVKSTEATSPLKYSDLPAEMVAARHPAIGQAVLKKWGFEDVVCESIGKQTDYTRDSGRSADITDVLIASLVLAEILFERTGDLTRCESVTAFSRLGMSPDALQAVLKHTEHSIGSLRDTLAS